MKSTYLPPKKKRILCYIRDRKPGLYVSMMVAAIWGSMVGAGAASELPHADRGRELTAGELRKSGTIHLKIRCDSGVQDDFETAVALLHSFFYDEARRRFIRIIEMDPECAMAHWGVAMTWIHPLWAPPTIEERAEGYAAIQRARALVGESELELGFIESVEAYYAASEIPEVEAASTLQCACCGPAAHSARAKALHESLRQLHRRFPDHVEVESFYLLARLGTVDPTDKTFAVQRDAGESLEILFEENPDHPGIAHYLIHAYDYPELAEGALAAARQYDDIAPWVPHALHMPTHIYTRLGMWQDSIEGNVASSLAARDHSDRYYEGKSTMDDLHAMDYLMFAYLQTGRDAEAEELLAHLNEIKGVAPGNQFASAYAIGAMPARFLLEREKWEDAATLKPQQPELVEQFPFAAAHIEFARAVGSARSGNPERAHKAIGRLQMLRDSVQDTKFKWWARQIDIQLLAAKAWSAFARGEEVEAERLFRESAKIEEETGTHPVTPGQILPAREQLGEMLLAMGLAGAALEEFERSLLDFPRRYNSHQGALEAAKRLGLNEVARKHATALVEMAGSSERRADELKLAKAMATRPFNAK